MPNYQRNFLPGGSYFFTVNLQDRRSSLLTDHIGLLRDSVRQCLQVAPFTIHAWVVLPDHIHAVWGLPEGDADYSGRWRRIKKSFTKGLPESVLCPVNKRGERSVWQKRFWEHTLRDQEDFDRHLDYVHYNPVKHGWVLRVADWPYSTFHRAVQQGMYVSDWTV